MRLNQTRRIRFSYTVLAFVLPLVGMLLVMAACRLSPFSADRAILYSDKYHQYYPFFVDFRRKLLNGESLIYDWTVGMGGDYVGLLAYYLGSPLNLLSVLVPERFVLHFYSILFPVKLAFAGLFFAIMLKKLYGRDDPALALFGSLYAFCAWALGYGWCIMWLDTFALLPLVMLGMVQLLEEKKFLLYTVTLALSVAINYYIGLFTCIFVFLVFFCYEICRFGGMKKFFLDLLRIACFSAIALGLTAVVSLATFGGLMNTQSSVNKFPTGFRLNIVSKHDLLGLLDGMRRVAGNMGGGLEPSFKEGLPNLYCGVGTVLLALLFLLSEDVKLRDKLCSVFLLIFFILSFLIRQLDYIWHGFHFPNMIPYRFSFLFSFVMLYMAYRAWLVRRNFGVLQILAAGFLTAAIFCCSNQLMVNQELAVSAFSGALSFLNFRKNLPVYLIYNVSFLVVYVGALLWGSWRRRLKEETEREILLARRDLRRRRFQSQIGFFTIILLEIVAMLSCFGCYFSGTAIKDYPKGKESTASMLRYMQEREEDTLFYRAEMTHSQTLNDGALNGYRGISAFTSSANVRVTEFMRALGYGAKNTYNRYCFEESSPVANLFLDLKYMLDRDGKDKTSTFFQEVHHFGNVMLYKNNAYLPLGFLAEPELAEVDFLASSGSFAFQNELFRAATNLPVDVWRMMSTDYLDILGNGVEVQDEAANGYCRYVNPEANANLIYSYVVNKDGFACVHMDLPKRNSVYVSINGVEQYHETYSLPQMLAVGEVQSGDIVDIRIVCKEGESGTATVNLGILDNELFLLGYARLAESRLVLTSFDETEITGTIDCQRDGLLYTSIPQNGNWHAYVDGAEAEITLVGDCMVGLNLTEGQHEIRFVYRNQMLTIGAVISAVSLAILLALAFLPKRREEAPAEEETKPDMPEYIPEN